MSQAIPVRTHRPLDPRRTGRRPTLTTGAGAADARWLGAAAVGTSSTCRPSGAPTDSAFAVRLPISVATERSQAAGAGTGVGFGAGEKATGEKATVVSTLSDRRGTARRIRFGPDTAGSGPAGSRATGRDAAVAVAAAGTGRSWDRPLTLTDARRRSGATRSARISRNAVSANATTCLQLLPTGHVQEPAREVTIPDVRWDSSAVQV